MLQVHPASASLIGSDVLPKAIDLFKSHLLQGMALEVISNSNLYTSFLPLYDDFPCVRIRC